MATLDELLSSMDDNYLLDDIQFKIDENMRTVSIPSKGVVLGVAGDKNVNHINFQMPRMYNGFDMSEFQVRINYVGPTGVANYYTVPDLTVDGDLIRFTWLVDSDACIYMGIVNFSVHMFKHQNGIITQAFNTTIGTCRVLEGLEADRYLDPTEIHDILEHLKNDLDIHTETKIQQIRDVVPDDYETLIDDVNDLKEDLTQVEVEIENARVDVDGTPHSTLKGRLDKDVTDVKEDLSKLSENIFYQPFVYNIPCGIGGIDGSGIEYNTNTRARSLNMINFIPNMNIVIPKGYKIRLALYDDGVFHAYSSWKTEGIIPTNPFVENFNQYTKTKFRLLIGKLDDTEIEELPEIFYTTNEVSLIKPPIESDIIPIVTENFAIGNYGVFKSDGYYSSFPILVDNGETYRAYAIRNYILLDNNLNIVKFASGGGGQTISIDTHNAKYIMFCWRSDDINSEKMSFAKSSKFVGGYRFNGSIASKNKWQGKTLIWTGDSIPHGQVASGTAPVAPYPKIVADNLEMMLKNYSIGGSTIAHKSTYGGAFSSIDDFNSAHKDTSKYYQIITGQTYASYRYSEGRWAVDDALAQQCRTPLIDRYQFMDDGDIICVAAGTNDFQYNWTDIGEIDEIGSNFDITTFYGALQYLCESLLVKYFGKVIIFCTPIKRAQTTAMVTAPGNGDYPLPTSKNTKNKTLREYGDIIKEVCNLYSIPVVDLYAITGLNPSLSSQSALFDSWKTHPYQSGHDMIGRVLTGQIKSLIDY